MGLVGVLLEFVRSIRNGASVTDSKCSMDGSTVANLEHYADPGDDSHPLPGDYVAGMTQPRSGGKAAVGYIDPKNSPVAALGEKRIYSRNEAGEIQATFHLKNDGEITAFNDNASVTVLPDGTIKSANENASVEVNTVGTITSVNQASTFKQTPAGAIEGSNGLGLFQLLASGTFNVNGVTVDTLGNMVVPLTITANAGIFTVSLKVDNKELKDHLHLAGIPPGNTGPNI